METKRNYNFLLSFVSLWRSVPICARLWFLNVTQAFIIEYNTGFKASLRPLHFKVFNILTYRMYQNIFDCFLYGAMDPHSQGPQTGLQPNTACAEDWLPHCKSISQHFIADTLLESSRCLCIRAFEPDPAVSGLLQEAHETQLGIARRAAAFRFPV